MHRKLTTIIRRLVKSYIIRRETKARGGNAGRRLARTVRKLAIKVEKSKVKNDFINSWRLGEIKAPDPEDHKRIFSEETLSWEYLLSLQKKYWRENI